MDLSTTLQLLPDRRLSGRPICIGQACRRRRRQSLRCHLSGWRAWRRCRIRTNQRHAARSLGRIRSSIIFAPMEEYCRDGDMPLATGLTYSGAWEGKPYDGTSPLFGTTGGGGHGGDNNNAGQGTIFELIPSKHGVWKHRVIYSFCAKPEDPHCRDGGPGYGLTMDWAGAHFTDRCRAARTVVARFSMSPSTAKNGVIKMFIRSDHMARAMDISPMAVWRSLHRTRW